MGSTEQDNLTALRNKASKLAKTFSEISEWKNKNPQEIAPQDFPEIYKTDISSRGEKIPDVKNKSWDELDGVDYKPVDYTHKNVFIDPKTKEPPVWADKDSKQWQTRKCFNRKFSNDSNHKEPNQTPNSNAGLPLNPLGLTGISGRGLLGKYGANQAGDPLIFNIDEAGILRLVTITRADGNEAFPGGMVDPNETGLKASARELNEEAGLDSRLLLKEGVFLGAGANGDPRNTDHAWMETRMYSAISLDMGNLKAGDDATAAHWSEVNVNLIDNILTFASHGKMLALCSDRIEKQIVAHILQQDCLSPLSMAEIKISTDSIEAKDGDLKFTLALSNSDDIDSFKEVIGKKFPDLFKTEEVNKAGTRELIVTSSIKTLENLKNVIENSHKMINGGTQPGVMPSGRDQPDSATKDSANEKKLSDQREQLIRRKRIDSSHLSAIESVTQQENAVSENSQSTGSLTRRANIDDTDRVAISSLSAQPDSATNQEITSSNIANEIFSIMEVSDIGKKFRNVEPSKFSNTSGVKQKLLQNPYKHSYKNMRIPPKLFKDIENWNGEVVLSMGLQNDYLDKNNYSDARLPVPGAGGDHVQSIKDFNDYKKAQGALIIYRQDWYPPLPQSYLINHKKAILIQNAIFIPSHGGDFSKKDEDAQIALLKEYKNMPVPKALEMSGQVVYNNKKIYNIEPGHCERWTAGAKFIKEFRDVEKNHVIVRKVVKPGNIGNSACHDTGLKAFLKDLESVKEGKIQITINGYDGNNSISATAENLLKEENLEIAINSPTTKRMKPLTVEELEDYRKNNISIEDSEITDYIITEESKKGTKMLNDIDEVETVKASIRSKYDNNQYRDLVNKNNGEKCNLSRRGI